MTDGLPPLPDSPVPVLEPSFDPELRARLEALVGATSLAGRLDAFVRLFDALLPSPREGHDLTGLLRRLFPTDAEVERLDRQPRSPKPTQLGNS